MTLGSLFPLTPALSLRERENGLQSRGIPGPDGLTNGLAVIPPLPKGEGWGEGKATVHISAHETQHPRHLPNPGTISVVFRTRQL